MNLDLLTSILTFLVNVPYIGPVIAVVVQYALPAVTVVTAFVAVWHAVVLALSALAAVPGLQGLSNLANALKTDDNAVEGFVSTWIVPILDRLSVLPLPTTSSSSSTTTTSS